MMPNATRNLLGFDEVTRDRGFWAMISSIPLRYIAATCCFLLKGLFDMYDKTDLPNDLTKILHSHKSIVFVKG
jgi:hypothetical protein